MLERVLLKKQGLDKKEYGRAEDYVHQFSIWSNEGQVEEPVVLTSKKQSVGRSSDTKL